MLAGMVAMLVMGCGSTEEAPVEVVDDPVSNPIDVTQQTLADPAALARLQAPGQVFLIDGFEAADGLENWFGIIGSERGATRVVRDPDQARTGSGVLRLQTRDENGGESGAGASHWFYPGYDTAYFRRYIRFAEDYDQGNLNHVGGSLYAVTGTDRYGEMGKAGIRPTGEDRFGAGFEPWRDWGRHAPPGAMMLYTYWMDMRVSGDGVNYWGNMFAPPVADQVVLQRGRWHCLEQMLKANTLGEADGEMAAWIDGTLYIHLTGFRWRTQPGVRPKRATLGLYVHESRKENVVWYDDVVLSTGYVGE